ncbi:MAG: hypothetical protein AB1414_12125 [bacterium]
MRDFILLIKAEMTKDYIFIKRYPMEAIGGICCVYLMFLGIFYSAKFAYGNQEPIFLGNTPEGWILGYLIWLFAAAATTYMSEQWHNEALTGLLEQLYISKSGPIYILLARVLSVFLYISVIFPIFFYIFQLSTGIYLELKLISTLPIFILTFLGLCGFGFFLAGMTLIFKRIGPLFLIVPIFPLGLAIFPIEDLSVNLQRLTLFLPLIYGVKLIRLTILQDQNFIVLFRNGEIVILLLNSIFYLFLGILWYKMADKIARNKGLLAHY